MSEKICERCGAKPTGMNLLDYCGICSSDLCPHCMAEGCCGNTPAISGTELDNQDDPDPRTPAQQEADEDNKEWTQMIEQLRNGG